MSAPAKGRPGGMLQINAAATRKSNPSQSSKSAPRTPAPRLRLIIRRLPPGLTETEFWTALGDEWQVGKGQVEWAAFKDGKVSKDPAKPSRPARAYLKAKDQAVLETLSNRVRETTFHDAKNTSKDSCLLGPPCLEFAPYTKMAGTRVRHDGRQGTIDQDQEFIDFLQSLTEPITKNTANGADGADSKQEKVTTTPLVQYLKEKKANKGKDASQSKGAKGGKDSKSSKGESKSTVVVKGTSAALEKAKVVKASQDAARAINKSVASVQGKSGQTKAEAKATAAAAKEAPSQPSPAKRERDRGNASAAARMLQRDLGLTPKSPRASRVASASTTEPAKADTPTTAKATPAAQEQKPAAPPSSNPPTGPRGNRTSSSATTKAAPAPAPTQRPAKASPQPSVGAKSAFLKHANPSQGVTEELLRTTFEAFGTITRCEIDKKKGLGYIDFEDTEALRKAMQASPIKVGNGQVVVLENRSQQARKTPQNSTPAPVSATTSAASKATSSVSNKAPATASATTSPTPAPAIPTTPSSDSAKPPTSSIPNPPTAPRGAARGGGRGGNRGGAAPGRGNFPASNRSTSRAGFRGGRGNFGPRGSRGGGSQTTAAAGGGEGAAAPPQAGEAK